MRFYCYGHHLNGPFMESSANEKSYHKSNLIHSAFTLSNVLFQLYDEMMQE